MLSIRFGMTIVLFCLVSGEIKKYNSRQKTTSCLYLFLPGFWSRYNLANLIFLCDSVIRSSWMSFSYLSCSLLGLEVCKWESERSLHERDKTHSLYIHPHRLLCYMFQTLLKLSDSDRQDSWLVEKNRDLCSEIQHDWRERLIFDSQL